MNYYIRLGCLMSFVLWAIAGHSQTASLFSGGAHGESLAHTSTTFQGISGIYGNIAGLAYIDGYAGDASYNGRYNLKELATVSLAGAYGTRLGTFGILASRYGFESYSESKVGLAYARKIGRGLYLGGMLDLLQYSSEGHGTTNKITFEGSLYSELTDRIHMGVSFFSPGTVKLTEIQSIPSRLSIGVKYMVSSKATLIADVTKIAERIAEVKLAVDYELTERVGLRMGSSVSLSTFHVGSYVSITENIRLTGAYSYSNHLGSTPSVSFTYGLPVSNHPTKDK